jgi:hypothetical protein
LPPLWIEPRPSSPQPVAIVYDRIILKTVIKKQVGVDWIYLAKVIDKWRALADT